MNSGDTAWVLMCSRLSAIDDHSWSGLFLWRACSPENCSFYLMQEFIIGCHIYERAL